MSCYVRMVYTFLTTTSTPSMAETVASRQSSLGSSSIVFCCSWMVCEVGLVGDDIDDWWLLGLLGLVDCFLLMMKCKWQIFIRLCLWLLIFEVFTKFDMDSQLATSNLIKSVSSRYHYEISKPQKIYSGYCSTINLGGNTFCSYMII